MRVPTRHFTATVFIVNDDRKTLLLWHKRLRRWMPPGGHIDPNELPEDAAVRECKEETGLDVSIIGEPQRNVFEGNEHEGRMLTKPYALLLEYIPACDERNEPAHEHMDFVFLARMNDADQVPTLAKDEGDDMRWFSQEEIAILDPTTEIFFNVKQYALSLLKDDSRMIFPQVFSDPRMSMNFTESGTKEEYQNPR